MKKGAQIEKTVLDKWRRNAFMLTISLNETEEKASEAENKLNIQITNLKKVIRAKKAEIVIANKDLNNIKDKVEAMEAAIQFSKKSFDQNEQEQNQAKEELRNFIDTMQKHTIGWHMPDVGNVENEINALIEKIGSIKIEEPGKSIEELENERDSLMEKAKYKTREVIEKEDAINILKEYAETKKKYSALKYQWEAIKEEIEKEDQQKQIEDELSRKYKDLITENKQIIDQAEENLQHNLAVLTVKRNELLTEESSLQKQLLSLDSEVAEKQTSAQQELDNLMARKDEQVKIIAQLEEQINDLNKRVLVDKETVTEAPKIPSISDSFNFSIDTSPNFGIGTSIFDGDKSDSSDHTAAYLDQLLADAQRVLKG